MVNTFYDPKTGVPYDYGVEAFLDLPAAAPFFKRFNVETGPVPQANVTTQYIDFITGKPVDLKTPAVDDSVAAMEKFLSIVEPWTNLTQPGYWNFPEKDKIPEDFLLPFGEFITKHGLEAAILWMYESTGLGPGNMTQQTMLVELQAFGTYMAQSFLGELGEYAPVKGNQALYNAIADDLCEDVLYDSTVIDSWRTEYGVFLTVQNHKTGQITLITARQLLIAIEPTETNSAPFDLSSEEKEVLGKFTYTREYSGIVNNAALVAPNNYANMAAGAAPDNYLVLPDRPFTNTLSWMGGENYFHVIIVGDDQTTEADAKALAQKNFDTLLKAGRLAKGAKSQELDWLAFSVHGPMHARVSSEEVEAGFFQQLNGLQGQRSTWWTGGAFSCNFQTTLWEFDETLFPKMLAELEKQ